MRESRGDVQRNPTFLFTTPCHCLPGIWRRIDSRGICCYCQRAILCSKFKPGYYSRPPSRRKVPQSHSPFLLLVCFLSAACPAVTHTQHMCVHTHCVKSTLPPEGVCSGLSLHRNKPLIIISQSMPQNVTDRQTPFLFIFFPPPCPDTLV